MNYTTTTTSPSSPGYKLYTDEAYGLYSKSQLPDCLYRRKLEKYYRQL